MHPRQAKLAACFLLALTVLFGPPACAIQPDPEHPPTATASPAPYFSPTSPAPALPPLSTPPPPDCSKGTLSQVMLDSTVVPRFQIYLPPCYEQDAEQRLPVLYLFHGQGSTDEQWLRLGVRGAADRLIETGKTPPFIIVMPYDKASWRSPRDDLFDQEVVNALLPYVDAHYRTMPDRRSRAVGGLSRGAGWALRLGLTRPDLFGIIGLHSPVVFYDDQFHLKDWLSNLPDEDRPSVYVDIGREDRERGRAEQLAALLDEYHISHTWHLRNGAHSEAYWQTYVDEYLAWYAGHWRDEP